MTEKCALVEYVNNFTEIVLVQTRRREVGVHLPKLFDIFKFTNKFFERDESEHQGRPTDAFVTTVIGRQFWPKRWWDVYDHTTLKAQHLVRYCSFAEDRTAREKSVRGTDRHAIKCDKSIGYYRRTTKDRLDVSKLSPFVSFQRVLCILFPLMLCSLLINAESITEK
ncbi:hypothetical protein DINM_005189 [Dirofilaria immitis]|nr:hypothetical protein [Dirofilaria immitis]